MSIQTGVQINAGTFPPLWRWTEDLGELQEAGVTRLAYPIPWCLAESAPGRFDFSLFEDFLRTAEQAGMRIVLTPVPEPPVWIGDFCLEEPRCRAALTAFFRALADRFGKEPYLEAWNLEEVSLAQSRLPATMELYHKYLESVFESVEALNAQWHRNYFSFDRIPADTPECLPDSPETMAFLQFHRMREVGFFKEIATILLEDGPKSPSSCRRA